MSDGDAEPALPISTTAGSEQSAPTATAGASLGPEPMERAVKYYPVLEIELDDLGRYAGQTTIWATVSGVFFSCGFTLYVESLLSPEASPAGQVLLVAGPLVCGVMAVASLVVSVISWVSRKSTVNRIQSGSKNKTNTITT